ncbi:D-arabinono-1,4-lactone oxidase [Thalassotalea profundi]|uniref:Oxidoreductase n=1 Tax=Thalassotalea profundi TaxID=2036687 RepID=A0ABQ3IU18_9GAMM|nr:D-arabinono-1,4-lactone oxidase [Thalassotalea profundi]GHE91286.1 oxidoreductase [Thalassotalea profundi]
MKIDKLNINRRTMLKSAAALGATSTLGLTACSDNNTMAPPLLKGAIGKDGKEVAPWTNWSGNQSSTPNERLVPKNTQELVSMIKQTNQRIRLVGAGHSFSPLVPINETQMSLAYFYGITHIDKSSKQFDVAANTFLAGVGEELWKNGLSLENMPDINTQTFGGAIATSTHGTGINYGSMSTTVKSIQLVNGLGEEITCSAENNSDIFNAARNNIGTLGAVTKLRIQAEDKFHLKETSWMMDLQEGLEQAESLRDSHRHFEFYALPHADYILAITIDKIPEAEMQEPKTNNGDAYETFRTLSKVVDTVPFLRRFLINIGASTVKEETRTGKNFEVFGNLRDIRFNEMEYSVPAEHGVACLREILTTIKKQNIDILFPMEFRYVKADNVWLSPFYQRDSCAISCHNFADKDYKKYFAAIEPIFLKYDGRPHWGKIHTLSAKQLRAKYPMYDEFLRVREAMDPKKIFTNAHINQVLALS